MDMTPEKLRDRLIGQLDERLARFAKYEQYYDGEGPMRLINDQFRQTFGSTFQGFSNNFLKKVVDTPVQRLKVTGFDFGDQALNDAAWKIWGQNSLPSRSTIAHTEASKLGVTYLLVDPRHETPRITVESGTQCRVLTDPSDPMTRIAGLKRFIDRDKIAWCYLYTDQHVYVWRSPSPVQHAKGKVSWREHESFSHGLGVVPLIPMENNPDLKCGRSDLLGLLNLQDAITVETARLLIASDILSYPMRGVTGEPVPEALDADGNPVCDEAGNPMADTATALRMSMNRFQVFESPDAKPFSLPGADLENWKTSTETLISSLAAQADIPAYVLTASVSNIAADSISFIESGLVAKIENKQTNYGAAYGEAMRIALSAKNGPVGTMPDVGWSDPRQYGLAQRYDAATKAVDAGVPYEFIWRDILNMSPTDITTAKKIRNLPEVTTEQAN